MLLTRLILPAVFLAMAGAGASQQLLWDPPEVCNMILTNDGFGNITASCAGTCGNCDRFTSDTGIQTCLCSGHTPQDNNCQALFNRVTGMVTECQLVHCLFTCHPTALPPPGESRSACACS